MNSSSHKIAMLTVGSTVSLSVLNAPAQAEVTGTAADLLPLNAQGISVETIPDATKAVRAKVSASVKPEVYYSPEMLQAVAHNVNTSSQEEDGEDTPDISDFIDLSFLEQFIDEDGDVNLPLGITVYEAMGTTSIGFGGDF